ncbi:MAG: phage holin family protein [Chloroflexota bacterium]|nr:MAG: phage holin family protein [Chloroflexota bacterium]
MKEHRRSLSRHPVVRILIIWVISVIGLIVMDLILDGLTIDSVGTAFMAAAAIGLLNALLWPFLSRVLLPFAVFTGGLLFLVLNGVIVWLAGQIVPGFNVDNLFWTGIWTALGITAVNVILSTLLTLDDDASYYRNVINKRIRRSKNVVETDVPGVFFLEIDGLAMPVLEKAMELGYTPTMKRWLEEGTHKLATWETDLSSQTSASQAGLLHGNNYNIPAFRWYDRQRKMIVASSNPDEVAKIEQDHSDGNGLLVDGGASRGNLLSGDAPNVMNTASTIKDFSRFHTADFYAYFADPYNFSRTLLLLFWDIILERYRFWQQRRKDVQPRLDRHHRNFKYALVRGGTTVFLRELNIYTLIGDMFAGTPSAYATFVGYDEVAHHSGVETHDAFDALYKIDQQFARLESAAEKAPRPYHFVILSDHGQSGGATFKQRYGKSLAEFVQELTDDYQVGGYEENAEGVTNLNNVLSDAMQHEDSNTARRAAGAAKRYAAARERSEIVKAEVLSADEVKDEELPGIVVMASGNLGLVYGTGLEERGTLEEIELIYPGMLDGLVNHEGIGFAMVRSIEHGPVVIGANGRNYLKEERIEGEDPLAGFGPRAAQHLIREDTFPNCPDILVNSFYRADTNEVAAFEELIGCHGGMGGYQTQPFVLYPAELPVGDGPLIGAAAVHHLMKGWVADSNVAAATEDGESDS